MICLNLPNLTQLFFYFWWFWAHFYFSHSHNFLKRYLWVCFFNYDIFWKIIWLSIRVLNLKKYSENDLKNDLIRSLLKYEIWSDLRSLFYQMILIWSNIRILEIYQYSAAQNQFETMRYLASYPAGHPARHPAGHLMGCPAVGHLVKHCVGCLEGEEGIWERWQPGSTVASRCFKFYLTYALF